VTSKAAKIALSEADLRAVAAYAADCAQVALEIFEQAQPGDSRPREAIDAARSFARAGARGNPLRDAGWAAHKAAREARSEAASEAARAAMLAASAAYLHPLADAHQVKHILGAAAHAARAAELVAGDAREVGVQQLVEHRQRASADVIAVLVRYPPAPPGGGRSGELLRSLDTALRCA
jgi:hypothetical protein